MKRIALFSMCIVICGACAQLPFDNTAPDQPELLLYGDPYQDLPIYVVVSSSDPDGDLFATQIVLEDSLERIEDNWTSFATSSDVWVYELYLPQGSWKLSAQTRDESGAVSSFASADLNIRHSITGDWDRQEVEYISDITGITFLDTDHGWICGNASHVLRTTDGGDVWEPQIVPSGWFYDVYFLDNNTGWVVGINIVLGTTNGGDDWVILADDTTGMTNTLKSVWFVDQDRGWAAGIRQVYYTQDGGDNWEPTGMGTHQGETVGDMFFIDQFTGWITSLNGIYKTTDGGVNWRWIDVDSRSTLSHVYFRDLQTGWLFSGTGALTSHDGGETWVRPEIGGNVKVFYADLDGNAWGINGGRGDIQYIPSSGEGAFSVDLPGEYSDWMKLLSFVNGSEGWAAGAHDVFHTENGGFDLEKTELANPADVDIVRKFSVPASEVSDVIPSTYVRYRQ